MKLLLNSVILLGFKSYQTKTALENLNPHLNCITGENGSGKSNIIDGISFALGISNSSLIRAEKFTNLIFERKMNFSSSASITLIFNLETKNSDCNKVKPSKKISLCRKLSLDGKNKYLLNNKPVEPSKILNFLYILNLNINNPHFIIRQGHIQNVVKMSPEEKLNLIENSIGTKHYNSKKNLANRVLDVKKKTIKKHQEIVSGHLLSEILNIGLEIKQYIKIARTKIFELHKIHSEQKKNGDVLKFFTDNDSKKNEVEFKFFSFFSSRRKFFLRNMIKFKKIVLNLGFSKLVIGKPIRNENNRNKLLILLREFIFEVEKRAKNYLISSLLGIKKTEYVQIQSIWLKKQVRLFKDNLIILKESHPPKELPPDFSLFFRKRGFYKIHLALLSKNFFRNQFFRIYLPKLPNLRQKKSLIVYNLAIYNFINFLKNWNFEKKKRKTDHFKNNQKEFQFLNFIKSWRIRIIFKTRKFSINDQNYSSFWLFRDKILGILTNMFNLTCSNIGFPLEKFNFYFWESNCIEIGENLDLVFLGNHFKYPRNSKFIQKTAQCKTNKDFISSTNHSQGIAYKDTLEKNVDFSFDSKGSFTKSSKKNLSRESIESLKVIHDLISSKELPEFELSTSNRIKKISYLIDCVEYGFSRISWIRFLYRNCSENTQSFLEYKTKLKSKKPIHENNFYNSKKIDLFLGQHSITKLEICNRIILRIKKNLSLLETKNRKGFNLYLFPFDKRYRVSNPLNFNEGKFLNEKEDFDQKFEKLSINAKFWGCLPQKNKKLLLNFLTCFFYRNFINRKIIFEIISFIFKILSFFRRLSKDTSIIGLNRKKYENICGFLFFCRKIYFKQKMSKILYNFLIRERFLLFNLTREKESKKNFQPHHLLQTRFDLKYRKFNYIFKKKFLSYLVEIITRRIIVEKDRLVLKELLANIEFKKGKILEKMIKQVEINFQQISKTLIKNLDLGLVSFKNKQGSWKGIDFHTNISNRTSDGINLFSGGQKSVISLCFIFSILMVKPAPLYIFDEIDAALDIIWGNMIGKILRENFKDSQFIIISLKNGFLQESNVIFKIYSLGGISQVLRLEKKNIVESSIKINPS